jgi:hypothetical protein
MVRIRRKLPIYIRSHIFLTFSLECTH